ncbi:DUF1269 domain-containing protein [Bradyrhizobium frederickii]|uniref:DUF1269 domain-containing protein n=1 Tax=Bradyrhizobium frederickii TaxID=2560054 RepID=A0A4Y9PA95_9BRAD|nr:DUF1269 domain-containing protein [Bradyrhizobium frederickii]TFV77190.1 DUF1269 domain-containing protein [Bradyrhizobium frederickii]
MEFNPTERQAVMSRFVVTTFGTEAKAYEGTHALKELHAEGELTLYGFAVIAKDAGGQVSIKQAPDDLTGTALGTLVGALVGLLGGPAGVVVGMTAGMMLGSIGDLINIGVGADFVDKVSRELAPGKTAVIAEVDEEWVTPLDARMEAIGGSVARQWRSDFEDAQIAKETAARKAELGQLKAEIAQSGADAKAKLRARINEVTAKLNELSSQAQTKLDKLEKDTDAKISALNGQVAKASAETKARIKQRLAALRAEHDRRVAKLREAGALIKEALAA